MDEEQLATNDKRQIVRIGNEVHRPTSWWTHSVHDLLIYLESVGFTYAPRVLGFDEHGREVLSYIEGESGKAGWYKIHGNSGLQNFARLLRQYHDAVIEYQPPADSIWAYTGGARKPGETICHGDFGPWNIAWDGEVPVGIIDWDLAFPAQPSYDIFYALEYSAPFRDDKLTREWHHFTEIPDRRDRIDVFLKAYGMNPAQLGDIVAGVAAMQRRVAGHEKYLAERGMQPQLDWVAGGDLDIVEARARWTETHRQLFE